VGAIYEQDLSHSKPDAAPDGAKRVLLDRGYNDFAPTELDRDIAKCSTSPDEQKQNLGIDITAGRERSDGKQNSLEYAGVGARTVYFEAYQIPIHFKHGGV
jgi:hypothetical protein